MVVFYIFGGLTLISLVLNLWQWLAGRGFPMHQPVAPAKTLPDVTLFKPLKGFDEHTEECLRSWVTQDYPEEVRVFFGVKDADDPVCELVRGLIDEYPGRDLRLVICPETIGANPKVSTLIQLESLIDESSPSSDEKHISAGGVVVISDADVKASPGYLREAMSVLQRDGVGLVFSFYRAANPMNRAMWIEAVAVNCDFWSQICLAKAVRPIDFALGAAMSLRVDTLKTLGGFNKLKNYVADDNRLGSLIHESGQTVAITNSVVDCFSGTMSFKQVWDHQLRWARTIRACEPVPYFFSVLANALVWSLGWVMVALPFGIGWQLVTALCGLTTYAVVRFATACANGRKLTDGRISFWKIIQVLDVRDALGFVWWIFAFLGRTIEWRGRRYRVLSGGKIEPVEKK